MNPQVRLTAQERSALHNLRARLSEQGLRVSDDRLVLALLRAAASLPEDDLMRLVREGLTAVQPQNDLKAKER